VRHAVALPRCGGGPSCHEGELPDIWQHFAQQAISLSVLQAATPKPARSRLVCSAAAFYPNLPTHFLHLGFLFVQGLVGVLDAAEAACGRREGLPALLEGCIAASVEAAFDASLDELSANVSAGRLLSSTVYFASMVEAG